MTVSADAIHVLHEDETTCLLPANEKKHRDHGLSMPSFIQPRETASLNPGHTYNRSILMSVCLPILFLEFGLWVASATLTGSVPIYMRKQLGIDSVRATEINYALQSVSNLTPIVGGYVADQYIGRFNSILAACALMTVGMILCTISTHPMVASIELLLIGLFGFIATAQGATAPCLVVLGADQFNMDIPAQRLERESFFNWFYWSINIGASISYAFLANLAVDGLAPFVSEEMGFFAAFGIGALVYFTAAIVFYRRKHTYRRIPTQGSALGNFFSVLREASTKSIHGYMVLSGGLALVPGIVLTTTSYFIDESSWWHLTLALAGAGSVLYSTIILIVSCQSVEWVELASFANGGTFPASQVRDAMQVMRILPYMSILVVFWAIYSQMETNFLLQGCQMDLRFGTGDSMISSAMLSILDTGVILLFIPVFDRLIYPTLARAGMVPTTLRKIGVGLVFSLAAMLSAGWIEIVRKQRGSVSGISSNCVLGTDATFLPMAQMSVWWHAPQYVLVGISEILTSITSYDLFYSEVPESMRSACQSLNMLTTTLGYIVAGAVNSIFAEWIPGNLNDGHLENIFFIMAALNALSLAVFVFISRTFEYSTTQSEAPGIVAAA